MRPGRLQAEPGLVSGGPVGSGAFGLPTNGPIGRTVADVAALLDVLARPVPGEPYLAPTPPPGGWLGAARAADPGRLRVGRFTAPMLADEPVHPDCLVAVDRAAALLTAAGHEVVDVPAPLGPAVWPLFEIVWYVLALAPVPRGRESALLPLTRHLRARGAEISAGTLTATLGELQAQVRLGVRRTAGCDLLLCPTLAAPQAPLGWFAEGATRPRTSTGNAGSRRTAPCSTSRVIRPCPCRWASPPKGCPWGSC